MQIFYKSLIWNIFFVFCKGSNDMKISHGDIKDNTVDKMDEKGIDKETYKMNDKGDIKDNTIDKMDEKGIDKETYKMNDKGDIKDNTIDKMDEKGIDKETYKMNDKGDIKDILNEISLFSNELVEKMKKESIFDDRPVCLHLKFDVDSVDHINSLMKETFQTNFSNSKTYVLVICVEKYFDNDEYFFKFIGDLLRKCDKKIRKREERYEMNNINVKDSNSFGRCFRRTKEDEKEFKMTRGTATDVDEPARCNKRTKDSAKEYDEMSRKPSSDSDDTMIFTKKYKNSKYFLYKFKKISTLTTLHNIIDKIKYESKKEFDRTITIAFNNRLSTYEGIMILNSLRNNPDRNINELILLIKKEFYNPENLIEFKQQRHLLSTNTISMFMYITHEPEIETYKNGDMSKSVLSLSKFNLSDNNYEENVGERVFDFPFPIFNNQKSANQIIKINNFYILPEVMFKYSIRKKFNISKPTITIFELKFSFSIFSDIKHFKKYTFHFIYNSKENIINMWCIKTKQKYILKVYFHKKSVVIYEMKKLFEKIKKFS
ncbi:hypothetical protein CWI37_1817p0010 [Hamiltosporidium tvaerminnensis]|uniref:Uncharacterized protein n=1 Tax=Hamiltosporidium tvaerminnensis TaxID=1176355 RepID=A0A4V2JU05_9MICR|nr:hypothetical protein CWI37_1817p0010 [Hamiltosporidium tvaerminnensis]